MQIPTHSQTIVGNISGVWYGVTGDGLPALRVSRHHNGELNKEFIKQVIHNTRILPCSPPGILLIIVIVFKLIIV
jgi:hypothetical protein